MDPQFRVDYLPDPADHRARLALALYREALGVNSDPFKFLGFYKIINVLHPDGKTQIAWINRVVNLVDDYEALKRLTEVTSQESDVGEYLYGSGRCAVAHAFSQPTVDPDDPKDTMRLKNDLPLIKALAEYAVEYELGVQSQRTVWREHLYELDGFRSLIGADVIDRIKEGQQIPAGEVPTLPKLHLRLRDSPPFVAFENVEPEIIGGIEDRLIVHCRSGDGPALIGLSLNLAEERLEFDPEKGVTVEDDGSSEVIRPVLDQVKLMKGLIQNGQLEVWDAERQVLLGRTDLHPVNIDVAESVRNLDRIAGLLEAEAARRAAPQAPSTEG